MFQNFQFDEIFEAEVKQEKNEFIDSIRKTGVLANKCLNNEDFKKYRAQFVKAQTETVNAMIIYTNEFMRGQKGDMTVYAANMVRFVTKLNDLRILIGQVDQDITNAERVGISEGGK